MLIGSQAFHFISNNPQHHRLLSPHSPPPSPFVSLVVSERTSPGQPNHHFKIRSNYNKIGKFFYFIFILLLFKMLKSPTADLMMMMMMLMIKRKKIAEDCRFIKDPISPICQLLLFFLLLTFVCISFSYLSETAKNNSSKSRRRLFFFFFFTLLLLSPYSAPVPRPLSVTIIIIIIINGWQ